MIPLRAWVRAAVPLLYRYDFDAHPTELRGYKHSDGTLTADGVPEGTPVLDLKVVCPLIDGQPDG